MGLTESERGVPLHLYLGVWSGGFVTLRATWLCCTDVLGFFRRVGQLRAGCMVSTSLLLWLHTFSHAAHGISEGHVGREYEIMRERVRFVRIVRSAMSSSLGTRTARVTLYFTVHVPSCTCM